VPGDSDVFKQAATKAVSVLDAYNLFPGKMPDILASGQASYERSLDHERASATEKQRRAHRRATLVAHIRDNILHYMRAIWSSEDSDQRMRRYAKILVPTRWVFVPSGPPSASSGEVAGQFVPDYSSPSLVPLSEIIHPAGPIGYNANYAVFLMRGSPRLANMNQALATMRANYVRFEVTVSPPEALQYVDSVAYSPREEFAEYKLTFQNNQWSGVAIDTGTAVTVNPVDSPAETFGLDFEGIRVWLAGQPTDNEVVMVRISMLDELEDPELRLWRMTRPLPAPTAEAGFFSDIVLSEMVMYVPELRGVLGDNGPPGLWSKLDDASRKVIRRYYHRFLLARGNTIRFALDTNNLVLDLETGDKPALEEFKRLHRYVDVLKEVEEQRRRAVENQRRQLRLDNADLGDPEVERVTVVGSATELRGLVGGVLDSTEEPE
jgi:hypothetical protein